MNELYLKLIVGFLRHAATPVTLWLNERDILTENESLQLIAAIGVFALAYVGSWFNKLNLLRERNTALAVPETKTPDQVKAMVSAGTGAPAVTPSTVVPVLSTGDVKG